MALRAQDQDAAATVNLTPNFAPQVGMGARFLGVQVAQGLWLRVSERVEEVAELAMKRGSTTRWTTR